LTITNVSVSAQLRSAIEAVPPVTEFPTVDQLRSDLGDLARTHPDICRVRRIGTSRLGDPIEELIVGSGSEHAVIVGGVHPNEPVGSVTTTHLARTLANDPELLASTDYTWHIVGCIDPDGMRLNEGWFAGPFTRSHYGRHFYRPAPDEQVEWTFPFAYKDAYFDAMLPETVALMRLIDDTTPAFMCSLHNGEFGGVYYYLSRPAPTLYEPLQAIPELVGLPLDTGEPEAPYTDLFSDAIFEMIRVEDQYEFMLSAGLDPTPSAGTSSADYAGKYETLTLVSEVPYWTNPASADDSPTTTSYAEALLGRARGLSAMAEVLRDVLTTVEPELTTQSAYLRASRAFVPMMAEAAKTEEHRARQPEAERPATVAEVFSCDDLVHCFRLRYGGMLLRTLDAELATGNAAPLVRAQHERLAEQYRAWCADADQAAGDDTVTLEIRDLVAAQFGAILAGSAHARTHRETG